jgi:hypothetical protein
MKSLVYTILWLLADYARMGSSSSGGAPLEACTTMRPGHGGTPQVCQATYNLMTSKATYNGRDTITGENDN